MVSILRWRMRFCHIIVNIVLVTYHMAVVKTNCDASVYF
jgi:hypothetical protein